VRDVKKDEWDPTSYHASKQRDSFVQAEFALPFGSAADKNTTTIRTAHMLSTTRLASLFNIPVVESYATVKV
jgi:hypothetical protein